MKNRQSVHEKYLFMLVVFLLALGTVAALPAAPGSDDVLAKLGLIPAAAKESVLDTLASGIVYNEAAMKAFKALPAASRAAVVTTGLGWIKAYAATAEFQAAYGKLRQEKKPEAPAPRPSADEQTKKMKADMEKSIAEMRQNMEAMDAETKKSMEGAIREMRAQVERIEKDPGQRDMLRQAAEMTAAEDKKRHKEELREWEQRYPADPRELIKRRINKFLAASAGVDFAAKLVARGDQMIFAAGDYEKKPPEWKLCFRAGREATEAARSFARSWLTELEKD